MAIAAKRPVVAYLIHGESLLRAHQVVQKQHQHERAKATEDSFRNKSATILIAKQKDTSLKSKNNPLRPIAQIALAQDPQISVRNIWKEVK